MRYLFIILLLFIACSKDEPVDNTICKECTVITNNPTDTLIIFACGNELLKLEKSGVKCIKINSKN